VSHSTAESGMRERAREFGTLKGGIYTTCMMMLCDGRV